MALCHRIPMRSGPSWKSTRFGSVTTTVQTAVGTAPRTPNLRAAYTTGTKNSELGTRYSAWGKRPGPFGSTSV